MPVYLGPYNDPLDTNLTHHWDTSHAPDCRNAAISVVRSGGIFNINVSVENSDPWDSTGNTITLYASYRTKKFKIPSEIDTYVFGSIFGAAVPPIVSPSPWTNQTVPRRTSLGDNPWRPLGTVVWTPSTVPPPYAIIIVVLTVAGVTPSNATQNSQVAVWVGP
jgi:hypothetical protein